MLRLPASSMNRTTRSGSFSLILPPSTRVSYPEVKSVDLLSSHKKGLGANRFCYFYDGASVKETVAAVDDKHMVLELSDYSVPMKKFFAEIAAKHLDSNKTDVSSIFHYTVKYGPIGHLLGVTLLKAKTKSVIKTMLAAINERVETRSWNNTCRNLLITSCPYSQSNKGYGPQR
jgi:hypothetical protein